MKYVTPHVNAQTQLTKLLPGLQLSQCNVDNKLKQFPLNLNEVDYLHFLTKLINMF